MDFERRDIILIAGIFLVVLGITQYVPIQYSSLIGILLYFGIKFYVGRRKQMIANDVGEGICMECGFKIIDKKCPNCDSKSK
ncbi:MAG: anaerobic ribonucleoside-triphosphate reductase [Nitrosopumilus sp.]|nr:anaerobic ribonucleoside-triphosphate reductase [Nitrosopumilus sp.]MDH3825610.1 anaerobic ribonucleoside-triphosphate reductase [Nitrosopumilus sp.]